MQRANNPQRTVGAFQGKNVTDLFLRSEGFRSLKEEEPVEFEISDNGGKSKAINVTGPAGAYVQGAPRRTRGLCPFLSSCLPYLIFRVPRAVFSLARPDSHLASASFSFSTSLSSVHAQLIQIPLAQEPAPPGEERRRTEPRARLLRVTLFPISFLFSPFSFFSPFVFFCSAVCDVSSCGAADIFSRAPRRRPGRRPGSLSKPYRWHANECRAVLCRAGGLRAWRRRSAGGSVVAAAGDCYQWRQCAREGGQCGRGGRRMRRREADRR